MTVLVSIKINDVMTADSASSFANGMIYTGHGLPWAVRSMEPCRYRFSAPGRQ
jgi:hypothetical protein